MNYDEEDYTGMEREDLPDGEDRWEMENCHKKARERLEKHPLFTHLNELSETITVLLSSVDTEDEFVNSQKEIIHQSLLIIKAKLYSALRSESYLVCMQNAASIRSHGEYLRLSSHTLNETKLFKTAYVKVFRTEMEEFRELFIEWVAEVKQMDKEGIEDEWGLF